MQPGEVACFLPVLPAAVSLRFYAALAFLPLHSISCRCTRFPAAALDFLSLHSISYRLGFPAAALAVCCLAKEVAVWEQVCNEHGPIALPLMHQPPVSVDEVALVALAQ